MNKSKKLIPIIGIIIVLVLIIAAPYNSLVKLNEEVENSYSQVSTQIQRRADLIPNLVNTVKGYANHEEEVLTKVTEARAKVQKAEGPKELAEANDEMTQAIRGLNINAIAEAYPELKANQNFTALQDELAGTENRIAVARKDYNETVKLYNSKTKSFPTVITAKIFNFGPKEYFQADAGSENAPTVDFN
ncbi:MAG: LemA family protein [Tissierellia bacterium]|nr:LemA family protein [Tissierellia bacterium]